MYVAIDDDTRLAYVEVRPDEQQGSPIDFISRAVVWFNSKDVDCGQIVSDNRFSSISHGFANNCKVFGVRHIIIRPCTSITNDKPERFITIN